MTQSDQNKTIDNSFTGSKFGKVFLTIITVFLVFAGPTYIVYGLAEVVNVDLTASFVVGIVLFIIGLFLMRHLVQKKIIT